MNVPAHESACPLLYSERHRDVHMHATLSLPSEEGREKEKIRMCISLIAVALFAKVRIIFNAEQ
jgi:hypothetical protein